MIQREQELNEIASEQGINPNMLRQWKTEFMEDAICAFDETRQTMEARRKEAALKDGQTQIPNTFGQLPTKYDFL